MTYNFTKFERDFQRGEAEISISMASALRFSAEFCKITNIADFEYAFLFYDASKKAIGIQPTHKKEKDSLKITKEKHSASISIEGFLKQNDLNVKKYHGRYKWTKEKIPNIGEIYILLLGK